MTSLTILMLIGCCLVFLTIAYFISRSVKKVDDFFIAARHLRIRRFFGAYSGANVTFTAVFIYLTATAVSEGNLPLWAVVCWIMGVFLFWWKYPSIMEFCKTGHTLHEYLGKAFDSDEIRRLASFVTIVSFVAGVSLEFYGFAWLMEYLTGQRFHWLIIGMVFLITMITYTAYGGFPATVATDLFQVLLIAGGLGLLTYHIIIPAWDERVARVVFDGRHFFTNPLLILAYVVLFVPFQFSVMDSWQRCVAAGGDKKVVRPATLLGGGAVAAAFIIPILIGISVGKGLGTPPENPLQPLLLALNSIPPGFALGLVLCAFLGSLFSTADTLLINAAYSLVYDQRVGRKGQDLTPDEFGASARLVPTLRAWVVILGIASILVFGLLFVVPLDAFILAVLGSQAILGILVLFFLFAEGSAKRRVTGARRAIIVGFATPILSVGYGLFAGDRNFVDGAPFIGVILALIVMFLSRPAPRFK